MQAENKPIIEVKSVSKFFGEKTALDNVNLSIRKGEFVTILGPSGCGKTTLLRLIAGFQTASEGEIYIGGKEITQTPPHRRPVNTVFQKYALFPHLNVFDNIAFGLKLKKMSKPEIEKKVKVALRMVGMTDYEYRDVNSLSGGQQQRVAIARAIVNEPEVLLLDEPLAALDLKMRKDMQMELKEMHKRLGITFVYVTHDQEEALTLSDTIVVMSEGRIQQIGTPIDIYNEPTNSFVADFIGESNILNGTMVHDCLVRFCGHDFECVDKNFGNDVPVDVVVRPEDLYIFPVSDMAQLRGVVQSCIFKGVHYEMTVLVDDYELLVQDYHAFEAGTEVGLLVKPFDIHIMHKETLLRSLLPFGSRLAVVGIRIDGQTAARQEFAPNLNILRLHQFDKILHNDIYAVFMEITVITEAEQVQLQRFAFYQTFVGHIRNIDSRKIRLSCHRTKAGKFRTVKFNPVIILRMLIREGFQNLRRIIAFISSFIA